MNINIRTHHLDITPALKAYALKKMEKLEKFFGNIQEILIELNISEVSEENKRQIAQATVKASGIILRAEDTHMDMYASIDSIFDKLEIQLKRYKEKLKDHRHKDNQKRSVSNFIKSESKDNVYGTMEDEPRYIRKPIDLEEAAIIIQEEKLDLVVFRNLHTEAINVLYRSKGNDLVLIETD